ncbi:MAG TPA: thiamine diphosphokinase, partial [Patescibacteria group bacterium]|nr:thiamine diphosphokinase [Patescibacteria group bacterium]
LSDMTNAKEYIKKNDYIICADGGTRYALALGITPDIILGDFDSLAPELQETLQGKKIEWIAYNKEKDETDSELALKHVIEKGYKDIFLFGVFGSRIDHMLTNFFALDLLAKNNVDVTVIEGNKEMKVITKHTIFHGKKGDLLSLIPLKSTAKKVVTKNLYYPLKNDDLLFGYSRGLSNVFTTNTAEVSLTDGSLLAIHEKAS